MSASLQPRARPRADQAAISSGAMVQASGSSGSLRKVQYVQRSRQRLVTGRNTLGEKVTVRPQARSRTAPAVAISSVASSGVASRPSASARVSSSPASGFRSASRSASRAATAPPRASSGMEVPSGRYRTGPDVSSRRGLGAASALGAGEVGDDEVAGRALRARRDGQRGAEEADQASGQAEPEAEQAWRAGGGASCDHILGLDDQLGIDARPGIK